MQDMQNLYFKVRWEPRVKRRQITCKRNKSKNTKNKGLKQFSLYLLKPAMRFTKSAPRENQYISCESAPQRKIFIFGKKKTMFQEGKSVNNKDINKNLAREENVGPYNLLAKTFLCKKSYIKECLLKNSCDILFSFYGCYYPHTPYWWFWVKTIDYLNKKEIKNLAK